LLFTAYVGHKMGRSEQVGGLEGAREREVLIYS
jgi:hypothetical protein